MKIKYPFVIEILNTERVHPLQAASNHSGEKMVEMVTSGGIGTIDYLPPKRSSSVVLNEILLPERDSPLFASLPEFLQLRKAPRPEATRNARNNLWLAVKWREKRKHSQFCRVFELRLPTDAPLADARDAVARFAERSLLAQGMIVDLAIHEMAGDSEGSAPSSRTAYLMCTTRSFIDGEFGIKNREWNAFAQLVAWRSAWFDALMPILDSESPSPCTQGLIKFAKRFGTKASHVFQPPAPPCEPPAAPNRMRL